MYPYRSINPWHTAVFVCMLLCYFISGALSDLTSCSAVRNLYQRQGFQDKVPKKPVSSSNLMFCKNGGGVESDKTCCTPVMEHKLSVQSRQDFDVKLKKLLNPFANLLVKKHEKIDEMFYNLLNSSQHNFHRVFQKTYGIIYLQNSFIFSDLFETFDNYFRYGRVDLQVDMNRFFKTLYKKLFTVINSQYMFSDEYLKCIDLHMDEMSPFGDEPRKLITNVKRSFVALRTFTQGLSTAATVVRNILKANPSVSCLHELMKMSHCSTCAGHLDAKPCLPYCLHVQQLCLAHQQPVANLWMEFVEAMQNLGDRLEGPFNVGYELPPIDLKISSAIMNFQESGEQISAKVFEKCGQPSLGRKTRSPNAAAYNPLEGELHLERLDFGESKTRGPMSSGKPDGSMDLQEYDEALGRLVREVKTKVKNSKSFWDELPSEMCKEARHHGASSCWTGERLGKYDENLAFPRSTKPASVVGGALDEQLWRLKVITEKLNDAFHGRDVSWQDEEWLRMNNKRPIVEPPQDDDSYEGSGSGWSENIRRTRPTSVQYPPDDEDGYIEEGSGYYSILEGSGDVPDRRQPKKPTTYNPYDPETLVPKKTPHVPTWRENPSASPSEKPMKLAWAIAVYLIPAVFTFLGTIGGT